VTDATWDDPAVTWDEPEPDDFWDEGGIFQGILWANEAGVWKRAEEVHPYGFEAEWQDPFTMWARGRFDAGSGTAWFRAWPYRVDTVYPGVENLRVISNTSSSITVGWDSPITLPIRYRGSWSGPGLTEGLLEDFGQGNAVTKSGLAIDTEYEFSVWPEYSDGNGPTSTITVSTGSSTPPSITSWSPQTYNLVNLVVAGTAPFTLRCTGGARSGNTYAWAAGGTQSIGGCVGREYWQVENAGGKTARFYTDDGTPAQSAVAGAIRNSLANPLPTYGRGTCAGLNWGTPPMAAHANFPYSNCTDGGGATRFQTGNYPRGWIQHQIGVPSGYRVRRFFMVQGDGAGNTEVITPVYSVDSGATFKRWSHFGGTWIPATDATINPGSTSPNGLLSISAEGSWDRDWNWRKADASTQATPYIPENATDLSQRWIYIRWGIVHLTGSFGANMGECWMEYQEPSTPAKAEVKATIAWG